MAKLFLGGVMYSDIRSRQLEGTFPGDPMQGVHAITTMRVYCGWGTVEESVWPQVPAKDWPPDEPAGIDLLAKPNRICFYQRVRSTADCRAALWNYLPVMAGFKITSQWYDAVDGKITMPPEGAEIVGGHLVMIGGYDDDENAFYFPNSWGPEWGKDGHGEMPYEYFDQNMIDAWIIWGFQKFPPPFADRPGIQELLYAKPDYRNRLVHVREIYDKDKDERLAWTFAVENEDSLEVEDFYVRPNYRNQGHAKALIDSLLELSRETHRPLKFWIPYIDCESATFKQFKALLRPTNCVIQESNVPWVAYVAC